MFLYTIREQIKTHPFLSNKQYRILFIVSVAINGVIWYVLHNVFRYYVINLGFDVLPLHYNIYFGIDFYGNFNYLYGIPGFGIGVILLNTFLGYYVFKRSEILSVYLMYTMLVIQIILGWAFFLIMKFNM